MSCGPKTRGSYVAIAWDALTLLLRVLCIAMNVLIVTELNWALEKEEPLVQRVRDVLIAMACVIFFPMLASFDRMVDISPGFDFRPILENMVWLAYTILLITLIRLWTELRLAYRRKLNKID